MVCDKRLEEICYGNISPANVTVEEIDAYTDDLWCYLERLDYMRRRREMIDKFLKLMAEYK